MFTFGALFHVSMYNDVSEWMLVRELIICDGWTGLAGAIIYRPTGYYHDYYIPERSPYTLALEWFCIKSLYLNDDLKSFCLLHSDPDTVFPPIAKACVLYNCLHNSMVCLTCVTKEWLLYASQAWKGKKKTTLGAMPCRNGLLVCKIGLTPVISCNMC